MAAQKIEKITQGSHGDKTLNARYDVNEYTVSIDLNGGAPNSSPSGWTLSNGKYTKSFAYGTTRATVIADFGQIKRTGYTHTGYTGGNEVTEAGLTLVAGWSPNDYVVRFYGQDGTTLLKTCHVTYDTVLAESEIPTAPTVAEHGFTGWVINGTTTKVQFTLPYTIAGDTDVQATYSRNVFHITYVDSSGPEYNGVDEAYGVGAALPNWSEHHPSRVGYSWSKWTENGSTVAFNLTTMPERDITLTANWTINQYTITFNTKGGSTVTAITGDYGASVNAPTSPTKNYYTFAKWQLNGEDYTFPSTIPAQDLTLDAVWTPITYTVEYVLNGGTNSSKNPTEFTVESKDLTLIGATRPYYGFDGWYSNAQYTGNPVTLIPTGSHANIVLYAKWKLNQYNVYIDLGEGSISSVGDGWVLTGGRYTKEFEYGTTKSAVIADFGVATRVGYDLMGYSGSETVTAEGMSLTANWDVHYKVLTLNLSGGSYTSTPSGWSKSGNTYTKSVAYGTELSGILPVPAKTYFAHDGWSNLPESMPDEDLTVTAKWYLNSISATLSADGEAPTASVQPSGYTMAYSSSNTGVATVSNGAITPVGAGTVNITVSTTNEKAQTITSTFTVHVSSVVFATGSGWTNSNASTMYWCTTGTASHAFNLQTSRPNATSARSNYVFIGWSEGTPASRISSSAAFTVETYPTVTPAYNASKTVTPIWGQYQHTVTFTYGLTKKSGTSPFNPASKTVLNNTLKSFTYTITSGDLPSGARFSTDSRTYNVVGWTAVNIGSATYGKGATVPTLIPAGDITKADNSSTVVVHATLTAVLRPIYILTVKYKPQDALATTSATYTDGTLSTAYTLKGWTEQGVEVGYDSNWAYPLSNIPSRVYDSREVAGGVAGTDGYMSYKATPSTSRVATSESGTTAVSSTIDVSSDVTVWQQVTVAFTYKKKYVITINTNWSAENWASNIVRTAEYDSGSWETATDILLERKDVEPDVTDFVWSGWDLVGWTTDSGSEEGGFSYTMDGGLPVGFVLYDGQQHKTITIDFGEYTYYAVWKGTATLRYVVQTAGLNDSNENISSSDFIAVSGDNGVAYKVYTVTQGGLYLGQSATFDIITSVPTKAAGTGVEGWAFDGWTVGTTPTIYAGTTVISTEIPSSTIYIPAGSTQNLTPRWIEEHTKSLTLQITSFLRIRFSKKDAKSYTLNDLATFTPVSELATDEQYEILQDDEWVPISVPESVGESEAVTLPLEDWILIAGSELLPGTVLSGADVQTNTYQLFGWIQEYVYPDPNDLTISAFKGWSQPSIISRVSRVVTLSNNDPNTYELEYHAIFAPRYTHFITYSGVSPAINRTVKVEWPSGDRYLYLPNWVGTAMGNNLSLVVNAPLSDTVPTAEDKVFSSWKITDPEAILSQTATSVPHTFTTYGSCAAVTTVEPVWITSWTAHIKLWGYTDAEGVNVTEANAVDWAGTYAGNFGSTLTINGVSSLSIPGLEGNQRNMWAADSAYRKASPNNATLTISGDSISFTVTRDMGASIVIYVKFTYATYHVVVGQGTNNTSVPGHSGTTWEYDVTYGQPQTLDVTDFAGASASTLSANGTYAFVGYARRDGGSVAYLAGEQYDAFQFEGGSYPAHGETVNFVALWGKFATAFQLKEALYGEQALITITATPSDAANVLTEVDMSNSTVTVAGGTARAVTTSDFTDYAGLSGNVSIHRLAFNTAGIYNLVFKPKQKNPNATGLNVSVAMSYAKLEFKGYSSQTITVDGDSVTLPPVVCPEPVRWTASYVAGTPKSNHVNLGTYLATVGLAGAEFGGWMTTETGTSVIQEYTQAEGVSTALYAAWFVRVHYILNGGIWAVSNQDIMLYRSLKSAYLGEEITLTSAQPLHATKAFQAWSAPVDVTITNNTIPLKIGTTSLSATWTNEDLEWYWGNIYNEFTEPTASTINEQGEIESNAHGAVEWHEQSITWGIEFNTNRNSPSHLTNITAPEEPISIVELRVAGVKNTPILWQSSFEQSEISGGNVTVPATDLPRTVMVDNTLSSLTTGRIWRLTATEWVEIAPINGNYTIPLNISGAVTTIYLRAGESSEILGGSGHTYSYIPVSSSIESGVGYAGAGEYTVGGTTYHRCGWAVLPNNEGHAYNLWLPIKPAVARTYKVMADRDGTWYFREINENWLSVSVAGYSSISSVTENNVTTYLNTTSYGIFSTSVRADEGYYAVAFSTHPTVGGIRKERMYVILIKIVNADLDAPLCKLTKKTSADDDPGYLYLSSAAQPNISITAFRRTFKAQLNQSPMLTLSSQFNYIIDLGNTETYTVSVCRVQPDVPDDSGDNVRDWTNGKWMKAVKSYFDQWQNANFNMDRDRSGGYNLIFDPVIDHKGYPKLDKNVFLSAPLTYKFERNEVNLSLTFTVASMLGRKAATKKEMRLWYNADVDGQQTRKSVTVTTYNNVFQVPPIPADSYRNGRLRQIGWKYWHMDENGNSVGTIVYPGDEISVETNFLAGDGEEITFMDPAGYEDTFACYAECKATVICTGGTKVLDLSRLSTVLRGANAGITNTTIRITAIGGGGGGGHSEVSTTHNLTTMGTISNVKITKFLLGGGGGSGGKKVYDVICNIDTDLITCEVGVGGVQETNGAPTKVYKGKKGIPTSSLILSAEGGNCGKLNACGAAAEGGYKGGENATTLDGAPWSAFKGNDGEPGVESSKGFTGGPGTGYQDGKPISSGGAASDLDMYFTSESSGEVYILTGANSLTEVGNTRVVGFGGSMKDQHVGASTLANDYLPVSSGNALHGGGGCSEVNQDLENRVNFNKKRMAGRSGPNHTPLYLVSMDYVCSGHSGADGIVIMEFYS